MERKEKVWNWIMVILLVAVSVAGLWKTVFLSADIDESYAVTLGLRLAHGDRLFREMWEVHQTSAVLYAPFIALYEKVTGGTQGLLVYLRIIGLLLQGALSVYGFRVMRRQVSPVCAFALSILYFNFTPKQIQSPEFTQYLYWGLFWLGLSLMEYVRTHCRRYAFRAAIALCVCILAYPYAIVLFFVCLILLIRWDRRESHAAALLFTLCCMGLGLLFMAYILSGISVTQLWENLSYVLMDESHDQSLKQMWLTHIGTIGEMLLPTFLILLVSQASILADKGRAAKRRDLTVSVAAVAQSALFVAQFHTITKVNFTVFLPLICQLTLFLGYVCWLLTREDLSPADAKREDGEDTGNVRVAETDMLLAMGLTGILGAVVVLSSSNLDANYSMGFLFTALLAVCLVTERILGRCVNVRGRMGFITVWAVRLTILVFGILLLVTRVFLVRFTSTQRKNIFEGYYETEHGPLGGIRLGEYDYRQYEAKLQALEEYVSEEDVFLYVGCDMFLYSGCDGRIGTGNTISTPAFGKQLLAYYDRYPERVPTVMFVDREYVADFTAVLKEEPFQSFVNAHYELDMTAQNLPIDVYRLTD